VNGANICVHPDGGVNCPVEVPGTTAHTTATSPVCRSLGRVPVIDCVDAFSTSVVVRPVMLGAADASRLDVIVYPVPTAIRPHPDCRVTAPDPVYPAAQVLDQAEPFVPVNASSTRTIGGTGVSTVVVVVVLVVSTW